MLVELERHAMSENSFSNLAAKSSTSVDAEAAVYDFLFPFFLFGHWLEKCPGL